MPLLQTAVLAANMLSRIRDQFRSHAPAAYVAYTLERRQQQPDGLPDLAWSYTYRVWYRASDQSALGRKVFRGRPQGLEFLRVMFDQACDPGPPTANLFELPPLATRAAQVASPPPLPVIASVRALGPLPYEVTFAREEAGVWHLRLRPRLAPERNRLRELWADAKTFEITKAVVTDKLFIEGGPVYDQLDTMTMRMQDGRPVITQIHARANFDDQAFGDGLDVDYTFSKVTFPAALPDWYFQPASYGAHMAEAPG